MDSVCVFGLIGSERVSVLTTVSSSAVSWTEQVKQDQQVRTLNSVTHSQNESFTSGFNSRMTRRWPFPLNAGHVIKVTAADTVAS